MNKTCLSTLLAGVTCAGVSANAATLTPVFSPPSGEKTHEQILEDILGGDFTQVGNDFTSGSLTVTRVDDDEDQSYEFASWSVLAQASWAGASQAFGTEEDGQLFAVTGDENSVSGSAFDFDGGEGIVFKRFGNESESVIVHTDPSLNASGRDHVVTYRYTVDDIGGPQISYLLFFEDRDETSRRPDWDYNDLVVELRGTPIDGGTEIPEPGSLALLGTGLLLMLKRRR
ncbi:MAG: PEP-CTERM sorting domain-containing protein [Planctomycetota bacterium]